MSRHRGPRTGRADRSQSAARSRPSAKQTESESNSANLTTAAATAKAAQDPTRGAGGRNEQDSDRPSKTQEDLDGQALAVVKLTDDLNQAVALRNSEQEKNTQAVMQIAQMKMVMDAHNLKSELACLAHPAESGRCGARSER